MNMQRLYIKVGAHRFEIQISFHRILNIPLPSEFFDFAHIFLSNQDSVSTSIVHKVGFNFLPRDKLRSSLQLSGR